MIIITLIVTKNAKITHFNIIRKEKNLVIKIGLLVAGSGLSVLGLLNLLFPYYGIDEQIRKRGIVSTQRTVKFVGTVLLVLGIGFLTGGIVTITSSPVLVSP